MGQFSVVGQQQQALRVLVQPPHRSKADTAQLRRQKVQDRGLLSVLGGGEDAGGLMQHNIGEAVKRDGLTGYGDDCHGRVQLVLGGGGQPAINTHQALPHQRFHLPAGPLPSARQQLVETLHRPPPSGFLPYDSIFSSD